LSGCGPPGTRLTGKDEVIGDPADAILNYTTRPIVDKSFS